MTGLSRGEKERIAARARTLQERLSAGSDGATDVAASDRIEQWREYVADGDGDRFADRLAREGLSLDECERRLSTRSCPSGAPLPDWVDCLDEIVDYVGTHGTDPAAGAHADEIAFSDAIEPFVSYARDALSSSVSEFVDESALGDLAEWLARRLSAVFSHTLFIEFKKYVDREGSEVEAPADEGPAEGQYHRFVEDVTDDAAELFVEYAFLGRLAVTSITQWVSLIEEFVERAAADWAELQRLSPVAEEARAIVDVEVHGDPHVGGRRVLKVGFDTGFEVGYKPRNCGIAAGFNELLAWLNGNSDLPDFRTVDVLPRPNYAWMEWVEPEECSTMAEVDRYYRRAGMYVCLLYATDAVDMHLENVVAEGEQPVVVDLETLAHPRIRQEYLITDREDRVRDSVLRTGAVPEDGSAVEGMDISCFGTGTVEFESGFHDFENVNTDAMELIESKRVSVEGDNLPRFEGETADPGEHVQAMCDGFREMYEFILRNRDGVLADGGPISGLCDRESRVSVVYRNSRSYAAVRKLTTHQPNLRRGLEFGIKVEALAKPMLAREVERDAWTVYDRERGTLRNWNTPRFTADLREPHLYCREEKLVGEFFETAPIARIRRRIRQFGRDDLETQVDLIRRGFSR